MPLPPRPKKKGTFYSASFFGGSFWRITRRTRLESTTHHETIYCGQFLEQIRSKEEDELLQLSYLAGGYRLQRLEEDN